MQYIHNEGIIHRDLHPDNIFFSLDNKVKIGDFSLSTEPKSTFSSYVGYLPFVSPEQIYDKHYDYTTDIYAMGMILYAMTNYITPDPDTTWHVTWERNLLRINHSKGSYFPEPFDGDTAINKLIVSMLDEKPSKRLSYGTFCIQFDW